MTTTQAATVEVFLKAFHTLNKTQRRIFFDELVREKAYREDLLDLATIAARRHEPTRSLRAYLTERSARQHR